MNHRLFVLISICAMVPHMSARAQATFKDIFEFDGNAGGGLPHSGVIVDGQGNLYGTNTYGGNPNLPDGTVFELSKKDGAWAETVLYSFTGFADGSVPGGNVTRDPATGTLYGTTEYVDGNLTGTIYQLIPPASRGGAWTLNTLYTFTDTSKGYFPLCEMLLAPDGTLYGTASTGGAYGAGVIFSLEPPSMSGGEWTYTVLHNFAANGQGYTDNQFPEGSLATDEKGNIFGATEGGVTDGTVWELSPSRSGGAWTFRVLHSFSGSDGVNVFTGVVRRASDGALFGGANSGGANNLGVVFELTPPSKAGDSWTEQTLYSFTGGTDGCNVSAVAIGPQGSVYGATAGLDCPSGSIFQLLPPADPGNPWTFAGLAEDASQPSGPLLVTKSGVLGTDIFGGPGQQGAVYEVSQ